MKRLFYILALCLALAGCGSASPPSAEGAVLMVNSSGARTAKATLAEAVTAAGSTRYTIEITTDQTLSASLTSPSNVEIAPLNGARINHGSHSVTYAGSTARWPRNQIFNGSGAVNLSSGVVFPEWFTANAVPGTTEMSGAIQKAVDSLPTDVNFLTKVIGGTISFDRSRYKISTRINNKRGVHYIGQGREATQIRVFTTNGAFTYTDVGNNIQDSIVFRDIGIVQDSSVVPTSGSAIEVLDGASPGGFRSQTLYVDNVFIRGTYFGIRGQALLASSIANSRVSGCISNNIRIDGSGSSTSVRISDTYTDLSGAEGILIRLAAYVSLINTASDSNTGAGYYLDQIKGLTLVSPGAEQNGGDYGQMRIEFCTGVTVSGHHFVTKPAAANNHGFYLGSNYTAVTIIGGSFVAQTGNTGYAIAVSGMVQPIIVNGTYFGDNYTPGYVYDQTNADTRIVFNNSRMASGAVPGLNNQIYNATSPEGTAYGAPGTIIQAPGNDEGSNIYIKSYGEDAYNWRNLAGFRFAGSVPTTGSYTAGLDIVWNTSTATGQPVGWVATVSGTFGTLAGTTGSITSGTATLTVNTVTGLASGRYITIAGVTGVKRIKSITGTVLTLDSNADATVSGAAVQFQPPTLKGFGTIL